MTLLKRDDDGGSPGWQIGLTYSTKGEECEAMREMVQCMKSW